MKKKPSTLSLCMIMKNEEKWIAQCLDSVKGVVDEIIIVDTGSTDRSKEIAESYGASIFNYEWNNNFAEARNYSVERASGEWILWLDADEKVDEQHKEKLRDVLDTSKWLGSIKIINYYGEAPPEPARSHQIGQYRLFRNDPSIRFHNAIHEQFIKGDFLTEDSVIHIPVPIHHYGYMNETVQEKQKSQRNLSIILACREEENYDPWFDYHLGSELYRLGDYEVAFECINLAITRFLKQEKLPPSIVYRLKYCILLEIGNDVETLRGLKFVTQLYPDYVDLHLYEGILLLNLNYNKQALKVFHHCLELGENNIAHLTTSGAGSFHTWYYIGLCHKKLGHHDESQKAFSNALTLCPNHQEALKEIGNKN
jgi:glycosyltransferase involved in cell wall biosynthesis